MSTIFSEAEFTAAMEEAVTRRGEGWRFPPNRDTPGFYLDGVPTYADEQGNATCLIGAAMHELRMPLPKPGTMGSAMMALDRVVPYHVMVAARIAQIHQDACKPWGEALAMYREAVRMASKRDILSFFVNDFYYEVANRVLGVGAIRNVRAELVAMTKTIKATTEAVEKMIAEKPEPIAAAGGWCIPTEVAYSWAGKPSVTLNFENISPQTYAMLTGPMIQPIESVVLTKGAHALTA
jgi:hypothetical protein